MTNQERPAALQAFAQFFRGYALGLSLIVAAIPVLSGYFDLMPFFRSTKSVVTGLASVASYLLVGFIFYNRHSLVPLYFPHRSIRGHRVAYQREQQRIRVFRAFPGLLGLSAIAAFVLYVAVMARAVKTAAYEYGMALDGKPLTEIMPTAAPGRLEARVPLGDSTFVVFLYGRRDGRPWWDVQMPDQKTVDVLRAEVPDVGQPLVAGTTTLFVLAFVFAVGAFVLMGLRDHLQMELNLSDRDILEAATTERAPFYPEDLPGVYGIVEYSLAVPDLQALRDGPFCINHKQKLEPGEADGLGVIRKWVHRMSPDDEKTTPCDLEIAIRMCDFDARFREGARMYLERLRGSSSELAKQEVLDRTSGI